MKFNDIPSGNLRVCYWKWPVSSLISLFKMVIFHSHVSLPEGISLIPRCVHLYYPLLRKSCFLRGRLAKVNGSIYPRKGGFSENMAPQCSLWKMTFFWGKKTFLNTPKSFIVGYITTPLLHVREISIVSPLKICFLSYIPNNINYFLVVYGYIPIKPPLNPYSIPIKIINPYWIPIHLFFT